MKGEIFDKIKIEVYLRFLVKNFWRKYTSKCFMLKKYFIRIQSDKIYGNFNKNDKNDSQYFISSSLFLFAVKTFDLSSVWLLLELENFVVFKAYFYMTTVLDPWSLKIEK
jgi:hypothetical protein